jgi:hypothetical protein
MQEAKKSDNNIPVAISERSTCIVCSTRPKIRPIWSLYKYGLNTFLTFWKLIWIIAAISLYVISNLKQEKEKF